MPTAKPMIIHVNKPGFLMAFYLLSIFFQSFPNAFSFLIILTLLFLNLSFSHRHHPQLRLGLSTMRDATRPITAEAPHGRERDYLNQ